MPKKTRKDNMKPNGFMWNFYQIVGRTYMKCKNNIKYDRTAFVNRDKKKGCIVIYNHQCDYDHFICTGIFRSSRTNYVLTKRFYFNKTIRTFLPTVKAIPREQFKNDTASILKMRRVTDNNGIVCIAPAGQETVTGKMPYIHPSIVKLLKLCKVDVYTVQITGSYLSYPKWALTKRKYPISAKIVKTLTSEELLTKDNDYCYQAILKDLDIDDFTSQKQKMIKIKGHDLASGLENVFMYCPKCGQKYTISTKDDLITCSACQNTIRYNEFGFFEKTSEDTVMPLNEQAWYDLQKENIKKELTKGTYHLSSKVQLVSNLRNALKLENSGEGILSFDGKSLYYDGKILGEDVHKDFNLEKIYQLPWCPGVRFNIPDDEAMYEFMPENGREVIEWVEAIEAAYVLREEGTNSGN